MSNNSVTLNFPLVDNTLICDKNVLINIPFFQKLCNAKMKEVSNDQINIVLEDINHEVFQSLYFYMQLESHCRVKFLQSTSFYLLCSLLDLMHRFAMDNELKSASVIFEERLSNLLNFHTALEYQGDNLIFTLASKKLMITDSDHFDTKLIDISEHLSFETLLKILELPLNFITKMVYLTNWIIYHPLEIHNDNYRNFMKNFKSKYENVEMSPLIYIAISRMNNKLLTTEFILSMGDWCNFLTFNESLNLILTWTKQNFLTAFPSAVFQLIEDCYKSSTLRQSWKDTFNLFSSLITDHGTLENIMDYCRLADNLSYTIPSDFIIAWFSRHPKSLEDNNAQYLLHKKYEKLVFNKKIFQGLDTKLIEFYLENCQTCLNFNIINYNLMPKTIGRHATHIIGVAPTFYNELLLSPFKIIKDDDDQIIELAHVNLPFRKIPIFYIPMALTQGHYENTTPLIKFKAVPEYDLIGDLSLLQEQLQRLVSQAKPNVNVKWITLYKDGLTMVPSETVQHVKTGIPLEKDLWKYRDESIRAYGIGFTLRIVIINNKRTSSMIVTAKKIMVNACFDIEMPLDQLKKRINTLPE